MPVLRPVESRCPFNASEVEIHGRRQGLIPRVQAPEGSCSSQLGCHAGKCLLHTGRNACLPFYDTRVPSQVSTVKLKAVFKGLGSVMDFVEFDILSWKCFSGCERGSKWGNVKLQKIVQEQRVA